MDTIVELVRQLEPETATPSADVRARQRALLLRSTMVAGGRPTHQRRRRPRYGAWFVAGAAAVVAIGALAVVGSTSPRRVVAPRVSAVLTEVTSALANTGNDVELVQSTASRARLASTSWVDVATGACRTDLSIDGQLARTLFVEHGQVVSVDYGQNDWWTRGIGGVTCEPLTPQRIEHDVASGRYRVVGRATIDGHQAIELASTVPTSGPHRVTQTTTLWVSATTYLPIQSTSTGRGASQTAFTWLPATAANTRMLTVTVPTGFRQVTAPPAQTSRAISSADHEEQGARPARWVPSVVVAVSVPCVEALRSDPPARRRCDPAGT